MKKVLTALGLIGLWLVPATGSALAADLPPAGAMPLSEILAPIQAHIAEAEFDDGRWEVKACGADACEKLYIDPHTGKQERRKAIGHQRTLPAGATPTAIELARRLEAAEIGVITELDFEHGQWEVKLAVPVVAP